MLTAIIDPALCIGCGICIEKCPFDAIIGAIDQMHTVLLEACIGCKLCVNPCPVDCISLAPVPQELLLQKTKIIAGAKQRRIAKINRIQSGSIKLINNTAIIKQEINALIAEEL